MLESRPWLGIVRSNRHTRLGCKFPSIYDLHFSKPWEPFGSTLQICAVEVWLGQRHLYAWLTRDSVPD